MRLDRRGCVFECERRAAAGSSASAVRGCEGKMSRFAQTRPSQHTRRRILPCLGLQGLQPETARSVPVFLPSVGAVTTTSPRTLLTPCSSSSHSSCTGLYRSHTTCIWCTRASGDAVLPGVDIRAMPERPRTLFSENLGPSMDLFCVLRASLVSVRSS